MKLYANPKEREGAERRYSATQCIGTRIPVRLGNPDPDKICTSFVDRVSLANRVFNRRLTRLTLGFSKKIEYRRHSVTLFVFVYNFIKIHRKHGQTPAQAAGLAANPLAFEDLIL